MADSKTPRYSKQVLEEVVPKAAKMLNGIGAEPVIRTLMKQAKMTNEHILEGGQLLLAALGHLPTPAAMKDTEDAARQREATAELDQWDEPNFARFGATLRRHHPSAAEYLFHNLSASTGAAAVVGVATLLNRVTALDKGSDETRSESKKDDKKAVELLAERGLDKKERARLAELVEVALRPTGTLAPVDEAVLKREEERQSALTALKDWYEEWSAAARVVVSKRGYLIRMGLAKRKVKKTKAP